ncbi:MAG: oligosaccharide flippase family protein [Clostridia bacterium]|nr:oligosaccharide flippase family protein [Clostridia bacterium]
MKLLEKWRGLSAGVKASAAYFFAGVISLGMGYITTPVFTNMLSPEEFGQASAFLTWVQVLGIIAMFCLSYGVFNNGMVEHPEDRNGYTYSMLILSNLITLVFSAVLLLLYPVLKDLLKMDLRLVLLMCGLFLVQPAFNLWQTWQRYEYRYKAVIFFSLLLAVAAPVVSIIAVCAAPEGERLYPRLFGMELTMIAIYAGFHLYLGIRNRFRVKTEYWKAAILFNLPLIPHYLSTYLLSSSDKLMIEHLVGDTAVAYYSVAHTTAAVVLVVWTAVNSSLLPYTYEKCKTEDFSAIDRFTRPILLLFGLCCTALILFAPEVVRIVSNEHYMEAVNVIPPIIGGLFFQVQYYIYANILYYYKKPAGVMAGSVTATVLNLVLNYVFIRKYGYAAAGYTTLISYIVQAVIDYIVMRRAVGRDIYNMKQILCMSAVMIVISLTGGLLYGMPAVRYGILLAMIVSAVVLRKRIAGIIRAVRKK